MRSKTTLRSPCKVWIKTDLQAVLKPMWDIDVIIPRHVTYEGLVPYGKEKELQPFYRCRTPPCVLQLEVSRELKGVNLWGIIEEAAYKEIEGELKDDWDEDCWYIGSLFRGNHYDIDVPLHCLGMHDGCTIHVVNQKNHKWVIFIKCPDGSVTQTCVYINDTAKSLHKMIVTLVSEKLPTPASEMYTSYSSKLLEYSNAKVWQLGMHNGSTVTVNVRLRGGICVPYSGNLKRKKNQVIVM